MSTRDATREQTETAPKAIPQAPSPIQLRRPGGTRILTRCMGYLRPYWRYVAGSYLLMLINIFN